MPDFDTSVPHIARVYDYWLGGKDNISQVVPVTRDSAAPVPIQ
jgi:S-adenosyl methyltransferase